MATQVHSCSHVQTWVQHLCAQAFQTMYSSHAACHDVCFSVTEPWVEDGHAQTSKLLGLPKVQGARQQVVRCGQ